MRFENDVLLHGHYAADFRRDLYKYDVTKDSFVYTFYSVVMVLLGCFIACFFAKQVFIATIIKYGNLLNIYQNPTCSSFLGLHISID